MEQALTTTATQSDPDFVTTMTKRWIDWIDQDGPEPSEELLRQHQGAFLRRRRRYGLRHIEIFATDEQYETLTTVMNTATNPRLTTSAEAMPARRHEPTQTQAWCRRRRGHRAGRRPSVRRPGPGPALPGAETPQRPRRRLQHRDDHRETTLQRRTPTPTHRHHRLPRPLRQNPQPPTAQQHAQSGTEQGQGLILVQGPGQRRSSARSTPPPSAKSPATPTSSPSCSAATPKSWTSAAPPGSSHPTSAKPSPPATKAAPSPTAPCPHPGAKPTTPPTGPTAAPHQQTTAPCSAATTTTSSTKNNGPST